MEWLQAILENEEIENKVEAIKKELPKYFVPKDKYNEVNEQKKEYKSMLNDGTKQLEELKAKAQGNEELLNKINELENLNKTTIEEYEKKIEQLNFDRALENALMKAKAKNIKAVKALLNLENIKLDGDNIIGLEEQLSKLQETDSYLFGDDKLAGREPNPDTKPVSQEYKDNPWERGKVSLAKQAEILEENPQLAKSLIEKAGFNPADYGL